jgi:LemA protein
MTTTTWIVLGIIAAVLLWIVGVYNSLVRLRNRTNEAWSDIDVQLKRRYDLIPNLIETVKGYAKQEQEVFTKVTEARANAMKAQTPHDKAQSENMLSDTLKSLFAVSENYPDLKSSQNFLQLQGELADTENKIQAARRFYNTNVKDLNIRIQSFPANLIAGMFGYVKREFFETAEGEKESVKVQF